MQLEVEANPSEWKPIVRYDAAHGGPHRDQLKIDGQSDKKPMNAIFDIVAGYRDAAAFAERDIRAHWKVYRQRFLEGKWPVR